MSSNSDEMLIDNHYNYQIRLCEVMGGVNHSAPVAAYLEEHPPAETSGSGVCMPGQSPGNTQSSCSTAIYSLCMRLANTDAY